MEPPHDGVCEHGEQQPGAVGMEGGERESAAAGVFDAFYRVLYTGVGSHVPVAHGGGVRAVGPVSPVAVLF